MHARTLITLVATAILANATLATVAIAQDAVVLARTARIAPGQPVTLADISRISGPGTDRLAALVLFESPDTEPTDRLGWFRVELDRVRTLLTDEFGEAAGVIALSGSACDVRVMHAAPQHPDSEDTPAPTAAAPDARDLVGLKTVRGAVARELSRILRTPPQALRLGFDDNDREFLDTSTTGRVVEIVPAGSSERMPVTIALYDPSGRVLRKTVRVKVLAHRPVAIVATAMPRGAIIGTSDITAESRWLPPTDRIVSPERAVGSVARRRLDPGEPLRTHLIEPPVMIERGDMVNVRVVTSGLVVRREANALEDGREGEVIEFAAKANPAERFRATVVARGSAVVWALPQPGTDFAMTSTAD